MSDRANSDKILLVDDDALARQSLYEVMRSSGYNVVTALDGADALNKLAKEPFLIVITDIRMPGIGGIELLGQIKKRHPETEVIMMTGFGTVENAVEAMKKGAFDYVPKPVVDDELRIVIEKVFRGKRLERENESLKRELAGRTRDRFFDNVGQDPKMQKIYQLIETVAGTQATVLIQGESGTGKRLVARAIHQSDHLRKDKAFVELSCGALPENILESELFGHAKGSFTSAIQDRVGRFEQAQHGTIFLDEVDTFSPNLQVKLLRVLQEREFERVGENKTIKVDVRVIAATNRNLEELISQGNFREDLYYRLNVINIVVPPLRERKGDIPLLVDHFIKKFGAKLSKPIRDITPQALDVLLTHQWPGNVRELENAMERAVILARGPQIRAEDLPETVQREVTFMDNGGKNGGGSLKEALKKPERLIIERVLEQTQWNRKKAAALLGINRTTLYNKMKEHHLLK
ncbi:MAG: sigma-54-dependent Fis family transcriptional regulator [Candidatus Omnitrophica bacterium]|nr:sigma-54-dependent Fis family transcriptional regulator [Candidatus Omnitrophota bacterium]